MGLFGDLFKTKEDTYSDINWIQLQTIEQLNKIVEDSKHKTQAIFKHSTRCGISNMVIKNFEKQLDESKHIDLYYLDLLKFREVSNAITIKFNIQHQSPQLVVIKNTKVVAHASHNEILSIKL